MESMQLKLLLAVCVALLAMTAGTAHGSLPTGWVEGHLSLTFLKGVDIGDDTRRPTVAPGMYAEYPLLVLTANRREQVARLTADDSGQYRTALAPGNYILDVENRLRNRLAVKTQPFTVTANETVHVDITVMIGHLAPAPAQ
jgi:hypothetical protein